MLFECKKVSFGYENQQVIKDLSFQVQEGEYVCVVGENGSGKTMLMRVIAGLVNPSSGQLLFDGKNRVDADPNIGIMIENASLYPELSGRENLSIFKNLRLKSLKFQKTRSTAGSL